MTQTRLRRSPDATAFARKLRQADNDAEAMLWTELKARRLGGYKFVRHFPVGPYFADFLCRSAKLVIEVDGGQHAGSEYDSRRDGFMALTGYSVLRFWNDDVVKRRDAVCGTILAVLEGKVTEPVNAADLKFLPAQSPLRQLRRHLSP